MKLAFMKNTLSIYRLRPDAIIPEKIWSAEFVTVTKTETELSIVVSDEINLNADKASPNWCGFYVLGPLAHDMVGVIAKLSAVLAEADCSVFTIATYDTDYILLPAIKRDIAASTLREAGYQII